MRIPHPPAGLSPAQIAAYTGAFLTLVSITVAAGLLIRPVGIILLVLFAIALLCGLAYFGMALYNDHADRRAQRQRLKAGELVLLERNGVHLVVDPQRSASPALAISAAGVTPLLAVDQSQLSRNIQAAAVQLAQAAPQTGGRFAEMIIEKAPPAHISTPAPEPVPQLAAPVDLNTTTVDLINRVHLGTGADDLLLGVDTTGQEVRGTLNDLMHTGLLAATGGGKTTTMSALALQLAHDPSVQIVVADPHLMELALLEDTGALRYELPNNGKQAVAILTRVAAEVHRRAELVNQVSIQVKALRGRREVLQRLDRYNRAASHVGAEQLPALVCFGDEIRALAALGPEAEQALGTITSEGRKFGVYFVGASQSWKTSVIDSDVRSQFWSRMCLPGATVRQTAELFEIEQSEARQVVAQLTAPGIAALWRRGAGTTILRTPFVDLESDRAYAMIEMIASNRKLSGCKEQVSTQPETPETFQWSGNISSPLESGISVVSDISSEEKSTAIDVEKREKVAEMLENGSGKMAIIKEVWGVAGGRAYQTAASEYDVILTSLTAN
jgi:energy-coupling factor transporter ATP-binding protein EcfA2